MAKNIFATDTEIAEFLRVAQEKLIRESRNLKKTKFQEESECITLNFKAPQRRDKRKAVIKLSEKAWLKIFALVHDYSTEVEWHGTVERMTPDTFLIKDILVFPHKVTGTTAVSDQETYEEWLNGLDDETFGALRFHGHSHVNMEVIPSHVDMNYRKAILNNFSTPSPTTDYFYIFLIFNKRDAISGEIYDLQNNALYSTDEINIEIERCAWLSDFLNESRKIVSTESRREKQKPINNDSRKVFENDYFEHPFGHNKGGY